MTPNANTYSSGIEMPFTTPLTMSSRDIAKLTGKRHDHVMRDIRKMLETLNNQGVPKFGDTYCDPQNGQTYPIFRLPKRETLILVSSYSTELRARIIDRWIELEARVRPLTPAETLLEQAKLMVAVERRQDQMESKQREQDVAIAQTVTRLNQIETATDHFTVVGYARWVRNSSIDNQLASEVGRRASRRARDLGIRIGKVPDPRFGAVSQYPKAILDVVWDECFPTPETLQ